jgi:hypothetical protein
LSSEQLAEAAEWYSDEMTELTATKQAEEKSYCVASYSQWEFLDSLYQQGISDPFAFMPLNDVCTLNDVLEYAAIGNGGNKDGEFTAEGLVLEASGDYYKF